jgi:hypothetical protein
MILIDTDHATYLKYPESDRGRRFIDRLAAVPPSEVIAVASLPASTFPFGSAGASPRAGEKLLLTCGLEGS